jgi:hypothetical protein
LAFEEVVNDLHRLKAEGHLHQITQAIEMKRLLLSLSVACVADEFLSTYRKSWRLIKIDEMLDIGLMGAAIPDILPILTSSQG